MLLLLAGCDRGPHRATDAFVAMGAPVQITVLAGDEVAAGAALRAARAEVERLEALLSDFRPASDVSRLNERESVTLAPETRLLLQRAQQLCRETGGAFDASIGPVKRLWGFGGDATPHLPEASALQHLLLHVGCETYRLEADGSFHWLDPEARLDLGGIAQGFVAGCVADSFRARGIRDFLIDISGDIVIGGERPGGGPWRIGVQNPRQPDSLLATVPMRWRAVTTSGDYEQFFIEGGVRYHHIFDPATGYPARGTASVSVFSDDPIAADCYATALFVLGPERGMAFLAARPDLQAVFVVEGKAGGVAMLPSAGIAAAFAHGQR